MAFKKLLKYRGNLVRKLPYPIRRRIYYRYKLKVPLYKKQHDLLIEEIKKRGYAKVLFVASSLSMWKYEEIFKLLISDGRFKVKIILSPFQSFSAEAKSNSIEQLKSYFSPYNVDIYNCYLNKEYIQIWMKQYDPDIIFYPMPYHGVFDNDLEAVNFYNKLLCYTPYSIGTDSGGLAIDTPFLNIAWKFFAATSIHYDIYRSLMTNKAENVEIVGKCDINQLSSQSTEFDWKSGNPEEKRLIWAPHYSIGDKAALHRDSFSWLYDFMLNLPERYSGKLRITFKPHPKLRTMLYNHPDWGKEKADEYYNTWRYGKYTQLCEGEYTALFATSDAMIHDSSSFMGEYLYTKKPVLFTAKNIEIPKKELNEFGNLCLNQHYIASCQEDIIEFISNVIFAGKDNYKYKREAFYNEYLSCIDEISHGERIYFSILNSFDWPQKAKIN